MSGHEGYVDGSNVVEAFEPIRLASVTALRALSDRGVVDDVASTRGNLEFSLHFVDVFDTLLADGSPELSAQCQELEPGETPPSPGTVPLGFEVRQALQVLEGGGYDEMLEHLELAVRRAYDGVGVDDVFAALAEPVRQHARLDEPPGPMPEMSSDERARLTPVSGDKVSAITACLPLFARTYRAQNEHRTQFLSLWEDLGPAMERLSEEHPGELEREVAMNFPVWHDDTDAYVFPFTNDLFNRVARSCANVEVADEAEYARTQALTWRRLTRMLLDYYDEGHSQRAYWVDMLVRAIARLDERLSGLTVFVVAFELRGAGVHEVARRFVADVCTRRRRRR